MSDKKLVKILFESNDGSIKYLEGEQAEKWDRFNSNVCQLAHFHGMNPDWNELEWKFIINNFDSYKFDLPKEDYKDVE